MTELENSKFEVHFQAAKIGDLEAMGELYQELWRRALAYANGIRSISHHAQEDSAQNAVIEAIRRISTFDTFHDFVKEVQRLAYRRALDYRKHIKVVVDKEPLLIAFREDQAPTVITEDEIARLHRAMGLLPVRDQKILRLHYYEGMNAEKISLSVGGTEANIYQLLSRSRKKMKDILMKMGKT